jgi:hypothetical protein
VVLDEADTWISYRRHFPTKVGQFGWRTLQTENTVEGEAMFGSVQMMKPVLKKLKLLTFPAARSENIDSESTTNHDQMTSMVLIVDWALKSSGAGRSYIDFGTITERYRPNPCQACPERRDQGATGVVGKCQLGKEMAD